MYFVVIGSLLLLMKVADLGPVGLWSWGWVLAPFGLAVVWWVYADATGYTKRREIDKMEQRKQDRRTQNLVSLGMDAKGRRGGKR